MVLASDKQRAALDDGSEGQAPSLAVGLHVDVSKKISPRFSASSQSEKSAVLFFSAVVAGLASPHCSLLLSRGALPVMPPDDVPPDEEQPAGCCCQPDAATAERLSIPPEARMFFPIWMLDTPVEPQDGDADGISGRRAQEVAEAEVRAPVTPRRKPKACTPLCAPANPLCKQCIFKKTPACTPGRGSCPLSEKDLIDGEWINSIPATPIESTCVTEFQVHDEWAPAKASGKVCIYIHAQPAMRRQSCTPAETSCCFCMVVTRSHTAMYTHTTEEMQ